MKKAHYGERLALLQPGRIGTSIDLVGFIVNLGYSVGASQLRLLSPEPGEDGVVEYTQPVTKGSGPARQKDLQWCQLIGYPPRLFNNLKVRLKCFGDLLTDNVGLPQTSKSTSAHANGRGIRFLVEISIDGNGQEYVKVIYLPS